jgi:hypothetical protein
MPYYLWCAQCEQANEKLRWNKYKFKYGVCPSCGCSAFRNAVKWESIYEVNGYEVIPLPGQVYLLSPTLDI